MSIRASVAVVGTLTVVALAALTGPFTEPVMSQEGYVGTATCAVCHPEQKTLYDGHMHSKVPEKLSESIPDATGIGCESCHGPGQAHVALGPAQLQERAANNGDLMILATADNTKSEFCMACHRTDPDNAVLLGSDYIIQNMQQYAELQHSRKTQFNIVCTTCHDPHTTSMDQAGITRNCLFCHTGAYAVPIQIQAMQNLACESCHMPDAVSGASEMTVINGYEQGELRSHVFGITADPSYTFNDGNMRATVNSDGLIRLTIQQTCYACHRAGNGPKLDDAQLYRMAARIHPAPAEN